MRYKGVVEMDPLGTGSFIRGQVSLLVTKHYLFVNIPSSGVPLRLLCCFFMCHYCGDVGRHSLSKGK